MSEIVMDKRRIFTRDATSKEKKKSKKPIMKCTYVYKTSKRHKR
jgi:hypothetical protein